VWTEQDAISEKFTTKMSNRLAALTRHLVGGKRSSPADEGGPATRVAQPGDTVAVRVTGQAVFPPLSGTTTSSSPPPSSTHTHHWVVVDYFEKDITSFMCGAGATGGLQPALSTAVEGLRVGESSTFTVQPGDAEHPQSVRDTSLIVTVPTGGGPATAGQAGKVVHNGEPRLCTVIIVDPSTQTATVDMNDPLAGRTMQMKVELLAFDAHSDYQAQLFPPPAAGSVPARHFNRNELVQHDGRRSSTVYIAVRGYVYDVTGAEFYAPPTGPYSFMGGHDATVSLASFSMVRCAAFDRNLHSCDQGHSSRVFTPLTGCHCKLPKKTEGHAVVRSALDRAGSGAAHHARQLHSNVSEQVPNCGLVFVTKAWSLGGRDRDRDRDRDSDRDRHIGLRS
jgi:FKBP-type peptidyl-prolyl cis-trans isomerase 2